MERRNTELREPCHGGIQTSATGRAAIELHVDRVSAAARRFVERVGGQPDPGLVSEWRTGAYIVASLNESGGIPPTEFEPSGLFLSFCGIDEMTERHPTPVRAHLTCETDRRLASTVHRVLPPEDVDLLVTVGRRHGRTATRSLLSALLPHLVELEYGIAASVGADLKRAVEDAA